MGSSFPARYKIPVRRAGARLLHHARRSNVSLAWRRRAACFIACWRSGIAIGPRRPGSPSWPFWVSAYICWSISGPG